MHKETICVQSGTYHDAVTRGVIRRVFSKCIAQDPKWNVKLL